MVKNLQGSIRRRYKTREKRLRGVIEDYLAHAEERLDESKAGKARDADEIKKYVEKAKALLDILPENKEQELDEASRELIDKFFGIQSDNQD